MPFLIKELLEQGHYTEKQAAICEKDLTVQFFQDVYQSLSNLGYKLEHFNPQEDVEELKHQLQCFQLDYELPVGGFNKLSLEELSNLQDTTYAANASNKFSYTHDTEIESLIRDEKLASLVKEKLKHLGYIITSKGGEFTQNDLLSLEEFMADYHINNKKINEAFYVLKQLELLQITFTIPER